MNTLWSHHGSENAKSGVTKLFLIAILMALAACAAIGVGTPEQQVMERAQARWDALVRGDYKAAYAYLSPGSRQVQSEKDYVNSLRRGFWKAAKVEKATCEQARCEVQATIEYEFQGQRIKSPLRETWIREGSDWWYVLRA